MNNIPFANVMQVFCIFNVIEIGLDSPVTGCIILSIWAHSEKITSPFTILPTEKYS